MTEVANAEKAARLDPDRLAELEEERRFLLRSLADLEREREVGDVDEADYEAIRDGYTSRAATVLRAIEQGRTVLPQRAPRNLKRLIVGVAVATVVAAILVVLVIRFAAPRGSNDTITGGTDRDRIAALLSDGRVALDGNPAAALQSYNDVLEIDPDNVEAQTYLGWLLALQAETTVGDARAQVIDDAKQALIRATQTDSSYADPYCFLALIAVLFEDDPPTASARKDECLERNPSADLRTFVVASLRTTAITDPSAVSTTAATPQDPVGGAG